MSKKKIPSANFLISLQVGVSIFLILKFFISNLLGVFLLFLSIYLFSPQIGLVEPFKPFQLIDFIATLPAEYKVATASSFMTAIGFLIAFQVASHSWRKQHQALIMTEASNELWHTYDNASKLITKAEIFSNFVIQTFKMSEEGCPKGDIEFNIKYLYGEYESFLNTKQQISTLSSELYSMRDKYYLITSSALGGQRKLDLALEIFSSVAKEIWVFLPEINLEAPNLVELFLNNTDLEKFKTLHNSCKKATSYIGYSVGYVKGYLQSPIIKPNIVSVVTTIRDIRKFKEFFEIERTD